MVYPCAPIRGTASSSQVRPRLSNRLAGSLARPRQGGGIGVAPRATHLNPLPPFPSLRHLPFRRPVELAVVGHFVLSAGAVPPICPLLSSQVTTSSAHCSTMRSLGRCPSSPIRPHPCAPHPIMSAFADASARFRRPHLGAGYNQLTILFQHEDIVLRVGPLLPCHERRIA